MFRVLYRVHTVLFSDAMSVAQRIVALDSSYNSHRPLPNQHSEGGREREREKSYIFNREREIKRKLERELLVLFHM